MTKNKLYIITSTAEAGTFETLPVTPEMELISHEELGKSDIIFNENQKVCITSEFSLATVLDHLDPARKRAVTLLKDKFRFREILSEIYPEYQYRLIKIEDVGSLRVDKKSVIKPVRGCFGTAVRVVDKNTDFGLLSSELKAELEKNSKVYQNSVLSNDSFIIEDFIEGEEYAVDMFYGSSGEPRIVNILHHPVPKNKAYIHMAYNSSKKAFDEVYDIAKTFLQKINNILKVRNFVMHVEIKVYNGEVYPIEINCMRFGGMGLCNLIYFSHGINSFTCFNNDSEPDLEKMWKNKEQDVYTYFIAYNGVNSPVDQYAPNRDKLKKMFTEVLHEEPFDHRKQLCFGVYFLRETEENISNIMNIEFDDFFEISSPDIGR
ncbi:MAG: hypothetical protein A2W91_03835 [Bacteroidetes bacterium GWF2_38_335]|nr:MAG: hypothetical protein A2W91_03835 [Bacteroidetes bacterium GWF2_38_335]OFY79083.1 MAG: hypothetical protein A2281_03170 [Bacteroidetes bacterium RIFOXYA12_FULL_38_20]HBS88832.1 hypothetical protein [Bacteroidales bacterium]